MRQKNYFEFPQAIENDKVQQVAAAPCSPRKPKLNQFLYYNKKNKNPYNQLSPKSKETQQSTNVYISEYSGTVSNILPVVVKQQSKNVYKSLSPLNRYAQTNKENQLKSPQFLKEKETFQQKNIFQERNKNKIQTQHVQQQQQMQKQQFLSRTNYGKTNQYSKSPEPYVGNWQQSKNFASGGGVSSNCCQPYLGSLPAAKIQVTAPQQESQSVGGGGGQEINIRKLEEDYKELRIFPFEDMRNIFNCTGNDSNTNFKEKISQQAKLGQDFNSILNLILGIPPEIIKQMSKFQIMNELICYIKSVFDYFISNGNSLGFESFGKKKKPRLSTQVEESMRYIREEEIQYQEIKIEQLNKLNIENEFLQDTLEKFKDFSAQDFQNQNKAIQGLLDRLQVPDKIKDYELKDEKDSEIMREIQDFEAQKNVILKEIWRFQGQIIDQQSVLRKQLKDSSLVLKFMEDSQEKIILKPGEGKLICDALSEQNRSYLKIYGYNQNQKDQRENQSIRGKIKFFIDCFQEKKNRVSVQIKKSVFLKSDDIQTEIMKGKQDSLVNQTKKSLLNLSTVQQGKQKKLSYVYINNNIDNNKG